MKQGAKNLISFNDETASQDPNFGASGPCSPEDGWAAWELSAALIHLKRLAHLGNKWALQQLFTCAIDLCDFLEDRAENAPERIPPSQAMRENVHELAAEVAEWPVLLPADARAIKSTVERHEARKIGSKRLLKIYRGERGRVPGDSNDREAPVFVARCLVSRI